MCNSLVADSFYVSVSVASSPDHSDRAAAILPENLTFLRARGEGPQTHLRLNCLNGETAIGNRCRQSRVECDFKTLRNGEHALTTYLNIANSTGDLTKNKFHKPNTKLNIKVASYT